MLPGGQTQDCAHESSHMTSSFRRITKARGRAVACRAREHLPGIFLPGGVKHPSLFSCRMQLLPTGPVIRSR
jgi:hypothetical protein